MTNESISANLFYMAYRRSANGNFIYLTDSITGEASQVTLVRFNEMVKQFGTEEDMEKSFQLRITKKHLLLGHPVEELKKLVGLHGGKLPPLSDADEAKVDEIRKHKGIKLSISSEGKKMGRPPKSHPAEAMPATSTPTNTGITQDAKEKPIDKYPWQSDPNYFKSCGASPLDIGEATKDTCMFPNKYIDTRCQACAVYDKCALEAKYTAEDWKKRDDRRDIKIRRAVFVEATQVDQKKQ